MGIPDRILIGAKIALLVYSCSFLIAMSLCFVEDMNYVQGWYSIVAVDYWGRHSPSSLPVTINWTS